MGLVLKDRVLETCTAPGTGAVTLLGAVTGYQTFSSAIGNANTCYYTIADQNGANWEVGIGTYTSSGNTLTRTTVLSSSNGGATTNFTSGTQNVFVTYPSERSVNLSSSALTSGRVTYATTDGLLTDSANMTFNGTTLTLANDASISGFTVGKGGGSVVGNTALGISVLQANTTGGGNLGVGEYSLYLNTTGNNNSAGGNSALEFNTTGSSNTAFGSQALTSNTTASNNTAVGYQAGYSNTTGTPNTAIGTYAGYTNSTGVRNAFGGYAAGYYVTGSDNTSFGANALSSSGSASSGANNTAIGSAVLQANTASNNTAVGYQSGYNNTTGTYNTLLGVYAGYTNSTGINNVFVGTGSGGYGAGHLNTTGSQNVAIGSEALVNNTTASYNTAVGYQAGYTNSTNTRITVVGAFAGKATVADNVDAFGYASLYNNTSGTNNVGLGYSTMYNNTTGNYNTAVGQASLYYNTTASNNTAVGYNAGYNCTTGNNVFIGYQAGYAFTASGVSSNDYNVCVGPSAGSGLTTGRGNTFIGGGAASFCGYLVTTGSNNTILGNYNGNQGSLDIRTSSNYIVLSDGAGNPRQVIDNNGVFGFGVRPVNSLAGIQVNSYGGGTAFSAGGSSGDYGSCGYNIGYTATSNTYKYVVSDTASYIKFQSGQVQTFTAASGTAGNTLSPTSGPYVAQGGTSWTSASDERLKNITGEIENGLNKVCSLRAAKYTWKSDISNKPQVGLIAQDVLAVLPEIVVLPKKEFDGTAETAMGINYDQVVPLLVAAIQELNAKVTALESQLKGA